MKFRIIILIGLFFSHQTLLFAQLAIKPARTISFLAKEGSYMDVDVSPDGRTLVFDLLGDLYTVASSGGQATQLTHGLALHLWPVWSPDGNKVACISDVSGSFHPEIFDLLTKKSVVLDRRGAQVDIDNFSTDIAWAANGNSIALGGSLISFKGNKVPLPGSVYGVLRFTSVEQFYHLRRDSILKGDVFRDTSTVISSSLPYSNEKALSPNTQWYAYVKHQGKTYSLILRDVSNKTEKILVPSLFDENSERHPHQHFGFSADSKSIYIGYRGKIHRINVNSGQDYIIPFVAHVRAQLGKLNYNTYRLTDSPFTARYIRSVNASPDGKHLVFSGLNRLYIMDLPNGRPRVLAPKPIGQFQPTWSPNGKWIAYVSWCDTVGGYLWRVSASGGKPEQLTQVPGQYQRPAWSPDGAAIAVIKKSALLDKIDLDGLGQLELIDVNRHSESIIADSVPLWNCLSFSQDGKRVVYEPNPPRNHQTDEIQQLVSRKLNGDSLKVLATGAVGTNFDQQFYLQRTISPDGRYLVYSQGENLYIEAINTSTVVEDIFGVEKKSRPIKFAFGQDPHWEKNGAVLSWSYGNKFYRINPDKIISAAARQNYKGSDGITTVKIRPAQTINLLVVIPKDYGRGTVALKNVRIITMKRNRVIENGTIIIRDGRFTAVGRTRDITIPGGAKTFDFKGKTVMPGFIDLHLHLREPGDIFPHQQWTFLVNLAYGITTARDPSSSYDSFGYAELLQTGQMIGPRLFTVGRPVLETLGVKIGDAKDALNIVRQRKLLGAIIVKQYLQPTRQQRQWLLRACEKEGLNMTNEGYLDLICQVGEVKDGSTGVEHSPEWSGAYADVVKFFARSGTWLTPTLQVRPGNDGPDRAMVYFNHKYWLKPNKKLEQYTPKKDLDIIYNAKPADSLHPIFVPVSAFYAKVRNAGGRVTLGSHGNNEGIGVHNELWALQMGGLTNLQALQAATIMGAEGLGVQRDVGSIEVGKIADLIILEKNPLEDIHNSRTIKYVMKAGILYDSDSLDELWPVKKKCPEWRNKKVADDQTNKTMNSHENSEDDDEQ